MCSGHPGRHHQAAIASDRLHADNGQTLGDLCREVDMSRQAVTKHLAILEEANLVVIQWKGREKLHFINPVPINAIAERWISKFEASHAWTLFRTSNASLKEKAMSHSESRFVYVTYIRTTQEKLWEALTTPEFMAQYWFGARCEKANGRPARLWKPRYPAAGRSSMTGKIAEADPPRRLVYRLAEPTYAGTHGRRHLTMHDRARTDGRGGQALHHPQHRSRILQADPKQCPAAGRRSCPT